MKSSFKSICFLLALTVFIASCASTTMIQSVPSGAEVYIDSQKKGVTPYSYNDTKIVGSATDIRLKKEGYEEFSVTMVRNERVDGGAVVGGLFFVIPFLWVMRYDPVHEYELIPAKDGSGVVKAADGSAASSTNSTNELIKLQTLLDQGSITKDDFTTLKVKILTDDYSYENTTADTIIKLKSLLDKGLLTMEEYTSQKNKLVNK